MVKLESLEESDLILSDVSLAVEHPSCNNFVSERIFVLSRVLINKAFVFASVPIEISLNSCHT